MTEFRSAGVGPVGSAPCHDACFPRAGRARASSRPDVPTTYRPPSAGRRREDQRRRAARRGGRVGRQPAGRRPGQLADQTPGTYPHGARCDALIQQRIDIELHDQEFEELDLELDDEACGAGARPALPGDLALAEQALAGFSEEFATRCVDDVARQIAVQTELGDEATARGGPGPPEADIEVSPRYGSWDPDDRPGRSPPDGPVQPSAVGRPPLQPLARRHGRPPRVVVGGLGPGRCPTCSPRARSPPSTRSRTASCAPAATPRRPPCPSATTSTTVYEAAASFDEVYATIVERLRTPRRRSTARCCTPCPARRWWPSARSSSSSPTTALDVDGAAGAVVPRPGLGPPRRRPGGPRGAAGRRPPVRRGGGRATGPLLVGQCDRPHVLSDIKLSVDDGPDGRRAAAPRPARRVRCDEVAWDDLDRVVEPDHLTSLWIPALAAAGGGGGGAVRRARPHAAGRVPVGPRADPRQPHPPPPRGDLRGARRHRPPRRGGRRRASSARGGAG